MKTQTADRAHSQDADLGTRERVLALIMERGSATAAGLARVLQLTPAAVRRHLASLQEQGLITTRERRSNQARGRGRPAKTYVATDKGRAEFGAAYDTLAIEVLSYLAAQNGPESIAQFARQRIAQLEQRLAGALPDVAVDHASLAEALAELLTDEGFMAQVQPVGSGEQLCQHHCPVAHVAARFPELCAAETEAFSRLLGSHVQRLATIAHGDGVCTTHIPRPISKETP